MSMLPPVFVELRAMIGQFMRSMKTAQGGMDEFAAKNNHALGGVRKGMIAAGAVGVGLGAAWADFAYHAVKSAADFQQTTNTYMTTAHETKAGYKVITDGILDLAGKVGYSSQDLAQAGYYVESMGHHGADGLKVLTAAAMGAKAENADLSSTVKAVTALMFDYKGQNVSAAQAVNSITQAVGLAGVNFQTFSEALPRVSSAAQLAKIPMADLTAALATMTRTGLPANVAATYLRSGLTYLVHPTKASASALSAFGINADKLSYTISSGNGGLVGGIHMLYAAVAKKLGPGILAAGDQMVHGKMSVAAFEAKLKDLPPGLHTTFGAIAAMSGGIKSMMGALILGGPHMAEFSANTKTMENAVDKSGNKIQGFDLVQKTFNFQLDRMKDGIDALKIRFGLALLPTLTKVAKAFADMISHINPKVFIAIALAVGVLSAVLITIGAIAVAMMIPIGAVVAGLYVLGGAAIIAGLVYLYVHFKSVRDWVNNAAIAVKNFSVNAGRWIASISVKGWKMIVAACQEVGKWAVWLWKAAIKPSWDAIVNYTKQHLVPIFQWFGREAVSVWNGTVKLVKPIIQVLILTLELLVGIVRNVLVPVLIFLWDVFKAAFMGIWDIVYPIIKMVIMIFLELCDFIIQTVAHVFHFLWDGIVRPAMTLIVDIIKTALDLIIFILVPFVDIFTGHWSKLKSDVLRIGHTLARDLLQILKDMCKLIGDIFKNLIILIIRILTDGIKLLWNAGKNLVMGLVHGIEAVASLPVKAIGGVVHGIIGAVSSIGKIFSPSRVMVEKGRYLAEGLALGISGHGDKAVQAMADVATRIVNTKMVMPGVELPGGNGFSSLYGSSSYSLMMGNNATRPNITIVVNGEIDRQALFKFVQQDALRYARTNGRNAFVN